MIELIKDIQEWHEKTFPEFSAKDQEMKLSAKGVYRKANGGTAQIGRRFWHIKLN